MLKLFSANIIFLIIIMVNKVYKVNDSDKNNNGSKHNQILMSIIGECFNFKRVYSAIFFLPRYFVQIPSLTLLYDLT